VSRQERGPERRRAPAPASFPFTSPNGETVPEDRRRSPDRRRNGFVSQQRILDGIPYGVFERLIERCRMRDLAPGEVLLALGQTNHALHLLLSGRLQIHLDSAESRNWLDIVPGECVGEMSIIDGQPVSAYVVAGEASRLLSIPEELFWSELVTAPGVARNLFKVLSARMRRRNDLLLRAMEQRLQFENLQRSLQAAHDLQMSMLPGERPRLPRHPQTEVHALMEPARDVGGDFYDAFELNERQVCLAVGDVSGKGMPAALFMVRALTLLRIEAFAEGGLAQLLDRLNRRLCEDNPSCMFVTLFLALVETSSGRAEYACAGHHAPLLWRPGSGCRALAVGKTVVLGVNEHARFQARALRLRQGDVLLAYTDGVSEALDHKLRQFGHVRLRRLLSSAAAIDPQALVRRVREAVAEFSGGAPLADDLTVLAMHYRGNPDAPPVS
jgi:sigma-B regulation protein RsbU (phosphoserine phosphatase)